MKKSLIDRLRAKNLHQWLPGYARVRSERLAHRLAGKLQSNREVVGPRHILFAFCDHYEPLWKNTDRDRGDARVRAWEEDYPVLAKDFRDADGLPPRHSFFFPGEEYDPRYIDRLTRLVGQGFGEVELHLHHDNDTAPLLREKIFDYLGKLAAHGHLSREPGGRLRYGFIHGNWCLSNGRSDGRWCGVNEEIPLLFETGCYADFTFPAAPDSSQPRIVNRIYWPTGDLARRRAYDDGEEARVGKRFDDRLLLVEGPLAPVIELPASATLASLVSPASWASLRPPRVRLENAAVTADDPGTLSRVRSWVNQGIGVAGRPEWVFVKVHTHGAPEKQAASLLGDGGRQLHEALTTHFNDGTRWALHYVTAREMFNIACAAMDGKSGDPAAFRDYLLSPPPAARA
jgi:hypothetical protein